MKDVEVIPIWDMSEEEWLATRRRLGIGGSDAGAILGVNKYKSPYALWMDKMGMSEPSDAGEAAEWGHILEPVIAAKYAKDNNVAVVGWPVILVSKEHEFMFANVDYWEVDPSDEFPAGKVSEWRSTEPPPGIFGILENKTSGIASPGTVHHWDNNSIPESYYWQGLHYSVVTGISTVTFAALLGGRGLVTRDMPIVDEDIEKLLSNESMFWDMVKNGTPPPVDGSDSTEEAQRHRFSEPVPGSVFDGGRSLQVAWDEFQSLKTQAEEADAKRKEARAKILEMVGNAEVGLADGQKLFTYKAGKQIESVDSERLRNEFPQIWEAVKKTRPGSRVLRKSS